jgi:hypothetical protein
MEGLEAKHGGRDPLYEAMILFDDVVGKRNADPLLPFLT